MGGYSKKTSGIERTALHHLALRVPTLVALAATVILLLAAFAAPAPGMTLDSAGSPFSTAERVLFAHVDSVLSYRDPSGGLRTRVFLSRSNALRGDSPGSFVLDLAGGTQGAVVVHQTDTPLFGAGEDVVLAMDSRGDLVGGMASRLTVKGGIVLETGESVERLTGRLLTKTVSPSVRRAFPDAFGLIAPSSASASIGSPGDEAMSPAKDAEPAVTRINPAASPAGTTEPITITGAGFGTQAGRVEFFYRDGAPAIVAGVADIVSWNDTSIVTRVPVGTVGGYAGASAGSGPVVVVTASGVRCAPVPFEVTYSVGPATWRAGGTTFRVTANCNDLTDELALVQAGASVWADRSSFLIAYAGASSAPVVGNGVNDISWDVLPSGILGQASLMFLNGTMIEADITLNDLYSWGDATHGADIDVQTVIAHELGHWLSLRDLYGQADSGKVMCGTLSIGQTRRMPTPADSAGIVHLYGSRDNMAPVTSAQVTPSAWTSGTATVALAARDTSPGVAATYYRIDGGTPTLYRTPFQVSGEGRVRVGFWSVDGDGLSERETLATVRIDRSAPETTLTASPSGTGAVRVDLAATDALSGVSAVSYSIDGAPAARGTSFEISAADTHTIEFQSTDNAGNTEPPHTETISPASGDASLTRISGRNRYETAAAISRATFAAGNTAHVVLATGTGFADALAASGLAGALEAPVLLNPTDELHAAVVGELNRLGASEITVVGGTSAISDTVATTLEGLGYNVTRIAGTDRYETAAMIAAELNMITGREPERVFVVRGDSFADALSAAPYAYSQCLPVLLTRPDSLPAATDAAVRSMGLDRATVIGGTGAVDTAVVTGLMQGGVATDRVSGVSRYATSWALLKYAIAQGWTTPAAVGVATGADFPDALGGGAAMGALDGALVLTARAQLDADSAGALALCAPTVNHVRVFGGETAVTPGVVQSIIGALAR